MMLRLRPRKDFTTTPSWRTVRDIVRRLRKTVDVYTLDPLQDPRWAEFVERHPRASIFHTPGWLRALEHTYGFVPIAFTTSPPLAALRTAVVVATVRSRLTGRRLISLPFSDHCDLLADTPDEIRALTTAVIEQQQQGHWRHVELRPATPLALDPALQPAQTFQLHRLDLQRDAATLLGSFHRDSIQRKIRRAEREGLLYWEGRTDDLLQAFCGLLELTRRRHQVPPQPLAWFRNLIDCLGDRLCIRLALTREGQPAAGILTLMHRDRMVYKYGGSDVRLNALGGVPWLFWKAIQDAQARGAVELDLGRSDTDNAGLIAFKEHWGASRHTLTYWRAPAASARRADGWAMRAARRSFASLPAPLQRAAGRLLYRHLA